MLDEWEGEVIIKVRERSRQSEESISKCKDSIKSTHLQFLQDFQRQYVLVPADKASNNVTVVCKKYCLDVVIMELQGDSTVANRT